MARQKSGLTLEALNVQIADLQAQAEALRAEEVAGVVARIRDAITHYGLTAADLGLGGKKARTSKGAGAGVSSVAGKPAGKSAAKKAPRTIKFADRQGHSWTGVGKRPNWFKDALASGTKPEDLLVDPAA